MGAQELEQRYTQVRTGYYIVVTDSRGYVTSYYLDYDYFGYLISSWALVGIGIGGLGLGLGLRTKTDRHVSHVADDDLCWSGSTADPGLTTAADRHRPVVSLGSASHVLALHWRSLVINLGGRLPAT